MEKRWRIAPVEAVERDRLAQDLGIGPILAALLLNRGMRSAAEAASFLEPKLTELHDPLLLPDMARAAARVEDAVRRKEPIAICGDYDVDGLSSTALLVEFFRLLGTEVRVHIPHRIDDGYGLRAEAVEKLASEGIRLIVTVDNGSSAAEEIALAARRGIDVVVTDHHEMGPVAPPAFALVNPKAPQSSYPFPHLAGVGVAFKLAWAVSMKFSRSRKLSPEFKDFMMEALALAALGTIADVVPLLGENRVLARHGLVALGRTARPGLKALVAYALRGRNERLSSEGVGFRIGPLINAAGRLGKAEQALRLLLARSEQEAQELVAVLDGQNRKRQGIEEEIHRTAREKVHAEVDLRQERAIVLADPRWHAGVVGIVAARICEEFCRPTILIALEGERGRGSGRSIRGVHLCDALQGCREHLIGFGGHAHAVGVEIAAGKLDDFRRALNSSIVLPPSEMVPEVEIEAEVGLEDLSAVLVREISRLEPHGSGNRSPLLGARDLRLAGVPRVIGQGGRHLSFFVRSGVNSARAPLALKAIAFGRGGDLPSCLLAESRFDLAFQPLINRWGGSEMVELNVKDLHLA